MRLRAAGYPDQMIAANLSFQPAPNPCDSTKSASHIVTGDFVPTSDFIPYYGYPYWPMSVTATITPISYPGLSARFRGLTPGVKYKVTVGTSGTYSDETDLRSFTTDSFGQGTTHGTWNSSSYLPSQYDLFRLRHYDETGGTLAVAARSDAKYLPTGEPAGESCYQSGRFSEEKNYPTMCAPGFGVRGVTCADDYCDDKVLTCCQFSNSPRVAIDWFGPFASEEDGPHEGTGTGTFSLPSTSYLVTQEADQAMYKDKIMSGMECSGSYCDNIRAWYTSTNEITGFTEEQWTAWGSEEKGFIGCPLGKFAIGIDCSGSYCDSIRLKCGKPNTHFESSETADERVERLAEKFRPFLIFDQNAAGNYYPSDPVAYYDDVLNGNEEPDSTQSFLDQNTPVYYEYQKSGDDEFIMYWYFYDKQHNCDCCSGEHWADWERILVKITGGMLAKTKLFQHSGHYTRKAGYANELDQTHPSAYIGKKSHGAYHDTGGSGTCLYFEDYRNPDASNPEIFFSTNLKRLPARGNSGNWPWFDSDWVWTNPSIEWNPNGGAEVKGPYRLNELFSNFEVCLDDGCGDAWFNDGNMGSGLF